MANGANELRAILLERGIVAPRADAEAREVWLISWTSGASRVVPAHDPARRRRPQTMGGARSPDCSFRRPVRPMGEGERRGPSVDDETGLRAKLSRRLCRRRRSCGELLLRPRHGGLARSGSATGGKPKLLGISKRGNKYLRKQLIHGARVALPYVAERATRRSARWAKALIN